MFDLLYCWLIFTLVCKVHLSKNTVPSIKQFFSGKNVFHFASLISSVIFGKKKPSCQPFSTELVNSNLHEWWIEEDIFIFCGDVRVLAAVLNPLSLATRWHGGFSCVDDVSENGPEVGWFVEKRALILWKICQKCLWTIFQTRAIFLSNIWAVLS